LTEVEAKCFYDTLLIKEYSPASIGSSNQLFYAVLKSRYEDLSAADYFRTFTYAITSGMVTPKN